MDPLRGPLIKERGAYYTEGRVAEALCRWAIRHPAERVLDPAFGGGVFLVAAARRLTSLAEGGTTSPRIDETTPPALYGVELDRAAHADALSGPLGHYPPARLLAADFLRVEPIELPQVDVVVGNPPFIRFQRLSAQERAWALECARRAGVDASPLAGSWVSFIAHSTAFLAPGGRMALVVPAEIGHAPYARPLLALIRRSFDRVTIVTFRKSLFPHLDQETVLLLADGWGEGPAGLWSVELDGAEALRGALSRCNERPIDGEGLERGTTSLTREGLDPAVRDLYGQLCSSTTRSITHSAVIGARGAGSGRPDDGSDGISRFTRRVARLAELGTIESGYVTGANSYFHVTPRDAEELGLPEGVLVPALFRSRALAGLRFDEADWRAGAKEGTAGYLVQPQGCEEHPAVSTFLSRLRSSGVHRRYKARTRSPWYRVGRVSSPPLILTAMAGRRLKLVSNDAGVAVPNTFHAVRPLGSPHSGRTETHRLAAAGLTSLTALSFELEGHALGGGMLKLDPGEAANVLLALGPIEQSESVRLDELLRAGDQEEARRMADRLLLSRWLHLSDSDISKLSEAADGLAARRQRVRRWA